MAATFNIKINVEGVLNGKFVDFGEIFAPFTIATTSDIKVETDVSVSATAAQIAAMTTRPALIVAQSTVEGVLIWKGTNDADTSAILVPANTIVFLPSGRTTKYEATPNSAPARTDYTALQDMTGLYWDGTGVGKLSYLIVG